MIYQLHLNGSASEWFSPDKRVQIGSIATSSSWERASTFAEVKLKAVKAESVPLKSIERCIGRLLEVRALNIILVYQLSQR
jgi:hypothetical protein